MKSPTYAYAHALVIAHWQHHHAAGVRILARALELGRTVTVVLGSAHRSRNVNHPFTWQERETLIRLNFDSVHNARLRFCPLADRPDDDVWCTDVRNCVPLAEGQHVVLVQAEDDPTATFYGESFPDFDIEPVECERWDVTSLRREYFGASAPSDEASFLKDVLSPPVLSQLELWRSEAWYEALVSEQAATERYRRDWPGKWHETADNAVTCAGHVLLIQRKSEFGDSLLALPGGFVDEDEMFFAAALRELREETDLHLALASARKSLRGCREFEHPLRSPRGRLVTHAFHFALDDATPPPVKAADDAKAALWVPLWLLPFLRERLFEDHAVILEHFLGALEALATRESAQVAPLTDELESILSIGALALDVQLARKQLILPEHAALLRSLLAKSR